MFGSSNENAGGLQNSNPFGHNQGSPNLSSFQSSGEASTVQTTFGQSFGFATQSLLPPGGLAGASPIRGFRNQPSLPLEGMNGAFSRGLSGTKGAETSFKPTNKNRVQNSSSTTFGSTSFGQDGDLSSSTSTNAHRTFGFASNSGQSSEFGSTTKTKLHDSGVSSFGGNSTAFGGIENRFDGEQTAFRAPLSNCGQGSCSQEFRGFRSDNATVSTPLESRSTAFGNQTSGVRVRKKNSTSNTAIFASVDNPFVAGRGATTTPAIHTTFGAAAGGNSSIITTAFGKPFSVGGAAPTTTFASVSENLRQPKFGSETLAGGLSGLDKMASMKTRMSGTIKAPSGQSEHFQGFIATEEDVGPLDEEYAISRHMHKRSSRGNTLKAPKASKLSQNKKLGKHRHARPKKKAPSTSDEESSFVSMPSIPPSSRDDNSKAQLSAATNLDGLCADMCSPGERELHIRVDELSVFEKCFPDRPGNEHNMIIKRFQRSSADHKLDIPEEIRPLGVLRRTQLYIERTVMDLDQFGLDPRFHVPRVPEPIEIYNFCWDRFRMIRKDCVLQNYRGAGGRVHPIALDIHERIARYHILSEHELIETPSFVAQQNMEQLGQTLKSLNELYDESHKVGDPAYLSPFEAECRAYFILCTLDNGRGMDVLKYVKDLPYDILQSPHIEFAMRVFVARHTGDYFQFFLLLHEATYLQSCLLFRYIPNVRSSALLRMNRAFRGQTYSLEDLATLLCFDDIEHAYAVCQEHQLKISGRLGVDDDSDFMVKFGGDFETDAQLRRNNTPLKTRSCKIFVGMKQGNFLRRDVCRGVTEYARDKYPALSKLIDDFEQEERSRLYPYRSVVDDAYSYFIDYNKGRPVAFQTSAQAASVNSFSSQHEPADTDQKTHDLGMIAQRKLELEQEKQDMLERMRMLEQTKQEKARRDQAKYNAAEEADQREELAKQEMIARAKAENEAARQQQEWEALLREQKKQREAETQRKRAEEAARETERQRLAAIQQAETRAAEEERRRQEKERFLQEKERRLQEEERRLQEEERRLQEEDRRRREEERQKQIRRMAAEELERRHQQDLERQAREAAHQAQLAKERAEKKRVRRIEKQRLAVLKLRLQLWKKYVQESRHGTGPILIDATKLRLDRPHQKATESIKWLFGGLNGVSGTSVGTKRRKKQLPRTDEEVSPSDLDIAAIWCPEDILGLVSAPLRRQNPGLPSIAWKLVIADLLDGASSSFGLWCAVRAGAQNMAVLEHDCYRTFQSSDGMEQEIVVCSRYVDSTFTERTTHEAQQDKLAATSAILLPVDMSSLQLAGNCNRWEQRVEVLLSSLKTGNRVTLFALGFASTEMRCSRELLIDTLRSCIKRVQSRFALLVVQVDFELIDAGGFLPHKFGQVLKKIATLSPRVRHLESVGLKELLEGSVKATMNQFESSVGIQSNMCAKFSRLQEDMLTSGVMDLAYPPPELQFAIVEPPRGWNSQEKRHEIKTILTALEVTRIGTVNSPLNCDETCDVYFEKVADFIDRLFVSYPTATAVSTYELKKRIYATLLPVHQRLTQRSKTEQVTPQDADVLLPWRTIFKEIYETFFETLNDITLYYQADCRFKTSVTRLVNAAAHSSVRKQQTHAKRDRDVTKQIVQVSAKSVRRSFGPFNAMDEVKQKYQAMGAMKRLCVEIDKEKAATSEYQRMLYQALNRWDKY
ncbi:unnamed protein product [Peronospora destructor]|uniref:SAC3/GANP/THP3 conserved domain-containing protein n=1 Tax=Peronospora destructor TaxID=86335 RepID=A0AAV0T0F1_9STRA|nr:unnamed protein product [Peronospora destructor]